jgi:hypothetical protein
LKYIKYILFLFLITILNLQCGVYGFRGNNPPEGIKTLAIPLFQDVSGFSEAGLKENFTEALKTKIINDNTFIIADKNVADGILNCTITNVKDEALVISGNENVTKRKITILVKVSFENLKKQKKIWEKQYDNWGEYNSSDVSFSARASGISTAQGKICDDILNDITSNW